MEKEEGYMYLEGYIPRDGSGVTIATGFDLGHGPDIFGCLDDVFKPKVLKYKTKQKYNLNTLNLQNLF